MEQEEPRAELQLAVSAPRREQFAQLLPNREETPPWRQTAQLRPGPGARRSACTVTEQTYTRTVHTRDSGDRQSGASVHQFHTTTRYSHASPTYTYDTRAFESTNTWWDKDQKKKEYPPWPIDDGWTESRTEWGEGGVRMSGIPDELKHIVPHNPRSQLEGRRCFMAPLAAGSRIQYMQTIAEKAREFKVGLVSICFNWTDRDDGFCHMLFSTTDCARTAAGQMTYLPEWAWMSTHQNPHQPRRGPEVKLSKESRTRMVRPQYG